jgi:hypothetical protein
MHTCSIIYIVSVLFLEEAAYVNSDHYNSHKKNFALSASYNTNPFELVRSLLTDVDAQNSSSES